LPPTPSTPRSRAWNCGIANAPARRTASAPARRTSLRNLPLHQTTQNQVWLEIVQIALDGQARRREPKRLRLRLFSAAARLVTTGRRRILRLPHHRPWTHTITSELHPAASPAEP
jgi:hypothetical protein